MGPQPRENLVHEVIHEVVGEREVADEEAEVEGDFEVAVGAEFADCHAVRQEFARDGAPPCCLPRCPGPL